MKIKKKTKPAATIEAVATIITFPGVDMSDCIKLLEKEYPFYGTQYRSWINDTLPRSSVLGQMRKGDVVTFREVPWENGTMYLCIDAKTGLDFGVLVNNVARKIRMDYYGCYMFGYYVDTDTINVLVYQPPGINL